MLINTVSPLPPAGYPKKKNGRRYWIVLMEAPRCRRAAGDFSALFGELFEVNDVISAGTRSAGRRRVFVRGLFTVLVPTVTEHPHRAEPKPPEQLFVRKRSSCSSKRFSFLLSSFLLSFSSLLLSFCSFLLSFCSSVSSLSVPCCCSCCSRAGPAADLCCSSACASTLCVLVDGLEAGLRSLDLLGGSRLRAVDAVPLGGLCTGLNHGGGCLGLRSSSSLSLKVRLSTH